MESCSRFQKLMAILPKGTAGLSILGSSWIVHHVVSDAKRRKTVYHRLLLGMSVSDIMSSFCIFLTTWPVPKGTPGVCLASGTVGTCTLQGFFAQGAAIATPSYNAMLSIYYVMTVCQGWHEHKIQRYLEPYLHAWPILMFFGTSIAGLPLTLFNPSGYMCWIADVPRGCGQNPEVPCERGQYSYIFRWVFFFGWIWFYFVFISSCIIAVYVTVLRQERRNDSYNIAIGQQQTRRNRKRSRRVAHQAILYVGAYYLTFQWGTIRWGLHFANQKIPEPLLICVMIFYPLQGFFNAITFFAPKFFPTYHHNINSLTLSGFYEGISSSVHNGLEAVGSRIPFPSSSSLLHKGVVTVVGHRLSSWHHPHHPQEEEEQQQESGGGEQIIMEDNKQLGESLNESFVNHGDENLMKTTEEMAASAPAEEVDEHQPSRADDTTTTRDQNTTATTTKEKGTATEEVTSSHHHLIHHHHPITNTTSSCPPTDKEENNDRCDYYEAGNNFGEEEEESAILALAAISEL